MGYSLENVKLKGMFYPKTFEVPSDEEIKKIKVGDYAKLIFIDEDGRGERMWVKIAEVFHEAETIKYKGILDNDPIIIDIVCGDKVEFSMENIADILNN